VRPSPRGRLVATTFDAKRGRHPVSRTAPDGERNLSPATPFTLSIPRRPDTSPLPSPTRPLANANRRSTTPESRLIQASSTPGTVTAGRTARLVNSLETGHPARRKQGAKKNFAGNFSPPVRGRNSRQKPGFSTLSRIRPGVSPRLPRQNS